MPGKTRKKPHNPKAPTAWVGTSGWSYDGWKGVFYPKNLPKKDHFGYFSEHFRTVELNATFYRLFPEKTFAHWAQKAPKGFIYACKMWRWVTHRKRLREVEGDLNSFFDRCLLLGEHLGPVLVQLPPGQHRDDQRLGEFLETLTHVRKRTKKHIRVAVEFRHASWDDPAVYEKLREAGVALCLVDMPKLSFPQEVTDDFTYVRFHGRDKLYQSLYTKEQLAQWAKWLQKQLRAGVDVYCYFNNDYDARAVKNARQLREMLAEK